MQVTFTVGLRVILPNTIAIPATIAEKLGLISF